MQPYAELELTTLIKTSAEIESRMLNGLLHPGAPTGMYFSGWIDTETNVQLYSGRLIKNGKDC